MTSKAAMMENGNINKRDYLGLDYEMVSRSGFLSKAEIHLQQICTESSSDGMMLYVQLLFL